MKRCWPVSVFESAAAPARKSNSSWLAPEWTLVAFLWFAYMLNHADRQVVYTLFPALQKEFGYSDTVLGLTGALFCGSTASFRPSREFSVTAGRGRRLW